MAKIDGNTLKIITTTSLHGDGSKKEWHQKAENCRKRSLEIELRGKQRPFTKPNLG